jgi:hypothetical protein
LISSSLAKLQPHSLVVMELVSKQLKHGHLVTKASKGALAAQSHSRFWETTGPDGRKHLVPCGLQSEEVVQHAAESVGSAVQEYGIVKVLQTLALARELPEWSAPSAGAREKALKFWDYCMYVAVGGAQQAEADILQLEGFEGIRLGGAMTMVAVALPRILPGVMDVVMGRSLHVKELSSPAVRQHPAVADKLKYWKGRACSSVDAFEAALQCSSVFMDTVPVSFCCCNPDCTSLQGVSELGLVFKAEGSCTSSSSSSRQKGCRPIGGGVCSGCGVSCYCSRKCQRQHWAAGHKEVCGSFASLGY